MPEDKTFIFHKDWFDSISALPSEQQDKILGDIIRYGIEVPPLHSDDPVITALVNLIKGRIDFSKEKYSQKVSASQKGGRKKVANDDDIYALAMQGKTSAEIAEELHCSKSTIDHSIGWKKRKGEAFSEVTAEDIENLMSFAE